MFSIFILETDDKWKKFYLDALKTYYETRFWLVEKDIFKDLKSNHYDLIIIDLDIKKEDPFNLLGWIGLTLPHTPVIMTSTTEKTELIVKSIKQGAFDFIVKPVSVEKMQYVVKKALENRCLKNEIDYLRRKQNIVYDFDKIIAFSHIMKKIMEILKKFSKTDSTILMTGDTGTGKSFLAGTIHFNSSRSKNPFITINCANIQETLLESELFGHEKGSFTGADKLRIGRFEQAHGGTLFLDEIGEISLALQAKLLRVLDEKVFERVGGNHTISSDVRVIVATNRNLEKQIADGKFREELYYRINILSIKLPPLRERKECIEPLAYWLLEKTCTALKKKIKGFSPESIEWIKTHKWPGNIRQLANSIERAVILEENSIIHKNNIYSLESIKAIQQTKETTECQTVSLETSENEAIINALKKCLWIQKDAAKLLEISPRKLNYKIKKYGIIHPTWLKNK